ncbi:hypothetical protein ANRL4_00922 [Anaerolineae bacterium]|nr:hypothetical protein ANRL4_00922 [Anaerolineae bacterium]
MGGIFNLRGESVHEDQSYMLISNSSYRTILKAIQTQLETLEDWRFFEALEMAVAHKYLHMESWDQPRFQHFLRTARAALTHEFDLWCEPLRDFEIPDYDLSCESHFGEDWGYLGEFAHLIALMTLDMRAKTDETTTRQITFRTEHMWESPNWLFDMVVTYFAAHIIPYDLSLARHLFQARSDQHNYDLDLSEVPEELILLLQHDIGWLENAYQALASGQTNISRDPHFYAHAPIFLRTLKSVFGQAFPATVVSFDFASASSIRWFYISWKSAPENDSTQFFLTAGAYRLLLVKLSISLASMHDPHAEEVESALNTGQLSMESWSTDALRNFAMATMQILRDMFLQGHAALISPRFGKTHLQAAGTFWHFIDTYSVLVAALEYDLGMGITPYRLILGTERNWEAPHWLFKMVVTHFAAHLEPYDTAFARYLLEPQPHTSSIDLTILKSGKLVNALRGAWQKRQDEWVRHYSVMPNDPFEEIKELGLLLRENVARICDTYFGSSPAIDHVAFKDQTLPYLHNLKVLFLESFGDL